jgi:phenylalanyl-tRNA synthetase beta chain
MKLPLSLIKSLVEIDLTPGEIGDTLTLLGLEVDFIHNEKPPFSGVFVGEVLTTKPHPDAKNLQIAEVSDGKEHFSLVCGAPNCRAGMKTAFAKVGALLTDAQGLPRRIEKTTIRGVESSGMLCSLKELQVSDDHEGIVDLPFNLQNGEDLLNILWDPVFEISLTPNLGHCMSALGVARELSAKLNIPLKKQDHHLHLNPIDFHVQIEEPRLAPHYICCLIENVKVGPSPFWLKTQLEAAGHKSINNVVDATNYVSMKLGQPLHAFDYDLLVGKTLRIAPNKHLQKFTCLDGVTREIPEQALVISDAKKPVAIAGVMGGENSAISTATTTILLEAAFFDPITIRNGAKKLSLRTESAQKFEKGVDPSGLKNALALASELIGGTLKGGVEINRPLAPKAITYRVDRVNQILGTKLSKNEIEDIFIRLGFKVNNETVHVPSFRLDLQEEIDLIEEVARIYGYNNIEKRDPVCTISQIPHDPMFLFENEMRRKLTGQGLFEFLTCDLLSPALAEVAKSITPASMELLKSSYSKSEEYSILRTSLLPGLLQVTKGNFAQKNLTFGAFEIGRIHFLQEGVVTEIPMAAILLTGKRERAHWSHKPADFDFFDLKGIIETFVTGDFLPSNHMTFHPGRQADIQVGDLIIGSAGEVHPQFLEKFDLSQRVYYAEINLLHLLHLRKPHHRMNPLSQFPASERDWTVALPLQSAIDPIFKGIESLKSHLLEKVELIDLYQPEHATIKNATFRFTYRDPFKTVLFETVEKEHAKIIDHLEPLTKLSFS